MCFGWVCQLSGIRTILGHLQEVLSSLSKSSHSVSTGMVCVLVDCQVQYWSAIHTLLHAQLLCATKEGEVILLFFKQRQAPPRWQRTTLHRYLLQPCTKRWLWRRLTYLVMGQINSLLLLVQINVHLNKVLIRTFLSAPTCPIVEFSLSMFGKWYWDFPLAEVMAHNDVNTVMNGGNTT